MGSSGSGSVSVGVGGSGGNGGDGNEVDNSVTGNVVTRDDNADGILSAITWWRWR